MSTQDNFYTIYQETIDAALYKILQPKSSAERGQPQRRNPRLEPHYINFGNFYRQLNLAQRRPL